MEKEIPVSKKNRILLIEIWRFLKANKAWWLAPVIIMFVLLGVLIILGQSSQVAPFVYALF